MRLGSVTAGALAWSGSKAAFRDGAIPQWCLIVASIEALGAKRRAAFPCILRLFINPVESDASSNPGGL